MTTQAIFGFYNVSCGVRTFPCLVFKVSLVFFMDWQFTAASPSIISYSKLARQWENSDHWHSLHHPVSSPARCMGYTL